ncbi:forkhead box protein P2-like [Scophthalmus maximus]|uniref:forkhead box protein P2-like n=1 Tax=Scophthalmus maximus TaxID=52904 RepID=UPI001FA87103|nr:forkhead box protein P2-like [Scophthalmus maximus]
MPESPLGPTAARQTPASSLLSRAGNGAAERVANGESCSGVRGENWQSLHHKQVFLAMMAPQQIQQLLSPNQLQALIHQKQQALLIQQQRLKEFYKTQQQQIHLQLLQQQPSKKVKELPAQQLVLQQLLQLQQQQQQQQQQLLPVQRPALSSPAQGHSSLHPSLGLHIVSSSLEPHLLTRVVISAVKEMARHLTTFPSFLHVLGGLSPAELQQLWKELTKGIREDKTTSKGNHDSSARSTQVTGGRSGDRQSPPPGGAECADRAASYVLYSHGVCNWPGCESVCENWDQFIKHMGSEHTLDDRSTAQCRVQMQVVQQLELQLCKERQRLRAMMAHLHLPSPPPPPPPPPEARSLPAPALCQQSPQSDTAADPRGPQHCSVSDPSHLPSLNPSDGAQAAPLQPRGCEEESPDHTVCAGAVRRRPHPLVYSLSSENEYELYKKTDIRPPFTYATLIRQAIMEASDMQLTLNEIYNWFTRTFAYFRRNAATWKNAVRHNLSLHKCFVRVEDVKGAVWTVDEVEYQRRRSQKITGSPSLMKNVSSSVAFGTVLNASFQTALADASLPGFKKESVSRNSRGQMQEGKSHSHQHIAVQVQRSLFLKDEAMDPKGREPQTATVKPAAPQRDVTGNDEEHLFDLE